MSIEAMGWSCPSQAGHPHPANRQVPGKLSMADFRAAVEMLPLVSLDLLVRDLDGRYLIGLRTNPPAQDAWFVPGGRVMKNEMLHDAQRRLMLDELGLLPDAAVWTPFGVYEHFYETNFAGEADRSTHYVVLAYQVALIRPITSFPQIQHQHYRWMLPAVIATSSGVHPYTQAYFKELAP